MTAKEYKEYKGLRKESLRDNMDNIELILTELSEEGVKLIAEEKRPIGLKENIKIARLGATTAKIAREDLEKKLEKQVVTKNNKLNYQYIETKNEEQKRKELENKNNKLQK